MNLSVEQQPSGVQQGGISFSPLALGEGIYATDNSLATVAMAEAVQPNKSALAGNALVMLEARMSGLLQTIAGLNAKNAELRKMIADRDDYIDLVEQENALLSRQVDRFMTAQNQVIHGLSGILGRFSVEEESDHEEGSLLTVADDRFAETVGHA
ncbi:hypothetical protein [Candidatus Magnetaquicoccus inordinatus]|uniref:hypothetical protein n=1 Tax=Candidatus Magnetaquicoccus inordinatus TaxID=2496818 RepID=UPI00102CB64D|nr:hypothetical protein [Candidatus Magnetaquicoccus inordinatus]